MDFDRTGPTRYSTIFPNNKMEFFHTQYVQRLTYIQGLILIGLIDVLLKKLCFHIDKYFQCIVQVLYNNG